MMPNVSFAGFNCVVVTLMAVPACEMRMVSSCDRVSSCKIPFCFPVMTRSFFVMVRSVVMMV
jgi:hypothetical protein